MSTALTPVSTDCRPSKKLTVKEAAELIGVPEDLVIRWCSQGWLTYYHFGDPDNCGPLLIDPDDLAAFVQSRKVGGSVVGEGKRQPKIDSPYLTVEEAAAYCRVAVQTIYNHRRQIERLPGTGKLLFTREALDKWLSTRKRR